MARLKYWDSQSQSWVYADGAPNVSTAVLYTPQNLSESQKAQVRDNIDALSETELSTAIDDALAQAKASGEFNGDNHVAYATCETAAATAEKVVTVSGNDNWELKVGSVVMVYFTTSNSASSVTLNVNGTGAYPIWYNNAAYTSNGTAYTGYAKRVINYMFNGTHWVWIGSSYDANTTYKNVALGHGYATCSTAEATTAKVGTLSSYALTAGGIVAVKFTNAVPANATLNINSKGAKNIFYRGTKITAGVIKDGDTATFIYDGTQYQLLSVDRWQNDIESLSSKEVVLYTEQTLTPEQKAQARANIGAGTMPEFVDSIEQCTDTSKQYVLPDGYIYAYKETQQVVKHTNRILSSIDSDKTPYNGGTGYKEGYRLNSTGVEKATDASVVSGFIPYNGEDIEIRLPSTSETGSANYLHLYNSSFTMLFLNADGTSISDGSFRQFYMWDDLDGVIRNYDAVSGTQTMFVPKELIHSSVAYIRVSGHANTLAANEDNFDVALGESLSDSTILTWAWTKTENKFGSDYGEEIADHESRLKLLEANTDTSGLPAYWLSELETKADDIQTAMETAGRNKSAFLWYTDAHWPLSSKKSPMLLKYLAENTPMNKVNFGGDIIGDPSPHNHANTKYAYEWRQLISGLPNHHSVYGNHDVYHRAANVNDIAYAQLLAPEESADMVVGGESYYYIDNPAEKTRYLYLAYITAGAGFSDSDTAAEMVAQGKFITNTLASVAEGWHIVAIAHRWYQYTKDANNQLVIEGGSFPFYEAEILRVFDAYNARATAHTSQNYIIPVDFTSAKGKVEFCIGGHCHLDYDFTTDGGIPVIITASDTNQERNTGETEDNGTLGTITESAVFGIIADYNDAVNTKITVVGVGRGTSRVIGGNAEPDEPVTVNLFNKDDPDVLLGGRINSSHNPVYFADGQLLTGYIEAKLNDVITIRSDTANNKNGYTGSINMYDANKTWLGTYSWQFTYNDTAVSSDDYKTVTLNIWDTYPGQEDAKAAIANTAFIRATVAYTDIDSIVITKA